MVVRPVVVLISHSYEGEILPISLLFYPYGSSFYYASVFACIKLAGQSTQYGSYGYRYCNLAATS